MKGYEKLDDVLSRAFQQASEGKGKERHANDLPFHEQPMQQVNRMVGVGFSHGQAIKKIVESQNMPPEQAVHELLGAICYIAGGIITLEAANDNKQPVKLKSLTMFVNGEPVNTDPQPVLEIKNAVHEYLDENYKLVEVEVGTMFIPDNWIRVPNGAHYLVKVHTGKKNFYNHDGTMFYSETSGVFKYSGSTRHFHQGELLWSRYKRNEAEERAYQVAKDQFWDQVGTLDMFTWDSKNHGLVTVIKGAEGFVKVMKGGSQLIDYDLIPTVFKQLEG